MEDRQALQPLTLQVIGTGAGAGVDSAWEQYKLEARKMLLNRADSHTSGARCVRPHGWQKKPTDEKNVFGAEALNHARKTTPPKNPPILRYDCEQDTTAKKTYANEINLAFTTAKVQKMLTGRPTY